MDIKDILDSLELDLSNPETKRGAIEAIEAILASRVNPGMSGGTLGSSLGGQEIDIELDPDLIQPSQKHSVFQQDEPEDIEINDEDDILNQIKHNKTDEATDDPQDNNTSTETNTPEATTDFADENSSDLEQNNSNSTDDTESQSEKSKDIVDDEVSDQQDSDEDSIDITSDGAEEETLDGDSLDADEDSDSLSAETDVDAEGDSDTENKTEDNSDNFDEEDLLDDKLKDLYGDKDLKTKHEARKIKRERTLQAAKKALADAKAKGASKTLVYELEQAIKALESLKEAVEKNIRDISDDEFNLMINRVFDAISAVGDSSLTFTSDEERERQVKEIKADLESQKTQNELSAEDVAQIRAEVQATKAREREVDQYRGRSPGSFKGFQDFLNSLYRAIALQVQTEESQDDSWSALNRRHSGTSVLQPGKKLNELPNKKIPIIDFYFDCSGSWTDSDLDTGRDAVKALVELEERGQIKINIYYFSDYVHTDPDSARDEGGTGAWNEIVKNIIATRATNVVIMTDGDMERYCNDGTNFMSYTVPGYVWYLWKRGRNAPRLPRDLKGRGGTQQFSFN